MRFILTFCMLMLPCFVFSQTQYHRCGKPQTKPKPRTAQSEFVDAFGNYYTSEDLKINGQAPAMMCGHFQLNIASSFTPAQQSTICEVFEYLSSIIGMGAEGTHPIINIGNDPILDENGNPDYVLGVGTPVNYINDCGVSPAGVYQHLYSGVNTNGSPSGYININPIYNDYFHTTDQDPYDNESELFDLFTLVLHEALHVFGFLSYVSGDGSSYNNTYSTWDSFLASSDPSVGALFVDDPNSNCCNGKMLNPAIEFPGDLENGCDNEIYFMIDGVPIVQVNSAAVDPNDPNDFHNLLGHIDNCDGDLGSDNVLNPYIPNDDTTRELSDIELQILYALGFQAPNGNSESCNVVANNDVIQFASELNQMNLSFDEILANDLMLSDSSSISISINADCNAGAFGDLSVSQGAHSFLVSNLEEGFNAFCYTITCGDFCDDGIVSIYFDELCSNNGVGTISDAPSEICHDVGEVTITYTLCLTPESIGVSNLLIHPMLYQDGFLMSVGDNAFFQNGFASINNLDGGACIDIPISLPIDPNVGSNSVITLTVNVISDEICDTDPTFLYIPLKYCEDPCSCQIPLSGGMVVDHNSPSNCPIFDGDPGVNDPRLMFDEQQFAQDAFCENSCGSPQNSGPRPSSEWFASWKNFCYPNEVIMDLGSCHKVRKISIFDTNGIDVVEFYGKCHVNDPWQLISAHLTSSYLTWCPVFESEEGIKIRYLKIVKLGHQSRFSELAICGEPEDDCCEDPRGNPIGDPIGDPRDPKNPENPWLPIREEDPRNMPWGETNQMPREENVYDLKVTPNPTRDMAWISLPEVGFEQAEIRDITGRLIASFDLDDEVLLYRYDVNDLPAGTYLIYLHGENGIRGLAKLLKL